MCLKRIPSHPIPTTTVGLTEDLFPDGSVYQFIGAVLYEQYHDEDCADFYPKEGQPALSPVLLSFVVIFQHLEDLSDR